MKAVLRLVRTYFLGTVMSRVLTVGGILLCLVSLYVVLNLPQSPQMLAFAMSGQLAFFLGTGLMPLTFGRLAQAQTLRLTPFGRVKLLASAALTVAIVALPIGLLTPLAYVAGVSGKVSDLAVVPGLWDYTRNLAFVIYTSCCLLASWLYLAMWFITSRRDMVGVAKAALVIVILLFAPAREIRELSATTAWNLWQLGTLWTIFGIGFVLWPRYQYRFARWRLGKPRSHAHGGRNLSGREVDVILGTTTPWLLMASLALPIVIASRVANSDPVMWLFFLIISSIAVTSISGQAAERSRALWLRTGWSRAELFVQAERSLARHNGVVLTVLVSLMVVLGWLADYPLTLFAIGIPALILGMAGSNYLGLMITRGLRWSESLLGACLVMALMAVALMAVSGNLDVRRVVAIELAIAAFAVACRFIARRRWQQLDWSQCRPVKLHAARAR